MCEKTQNFWVTMFAILTVVGAASIAGAQTVSNQQATNKVVIELFVRADSEQSQQAKQFVLALAQRRRGVQPKIYDVIEDRAALKRLWSLTRRFGRSQAKVPSAFLCDRLFIGFDNGSRVEDCLTIHAYVRSGCSICRDAKAYLADFQRRWPAVRVVYHDVIQDRSAQARLNQLGREHRGTLPVVPSFHIAGRLIVGFRGPRITGRQIEDVFVDRSPAALKRSVTRSAFPNRLQPESAALRSTRDNRLHDVEENFAVRPASYATSLSTTSATAAEREPDARPPPVDDIESSADDVPMPDDLPLPEEASAVEAPLPDDLPLPGEASDADFPEFSPAPSDASGEDEHSGVIEVPLFGKLRVSEWGLPAFTFLIGLIDGFNPCAMWVLVFLLSVLVNVRDRRKILLIAGTFVLVSGLAYFAFMAAWLNVFQVIGLQRPVQIGLGCLAIFIGVVNVKDFFAFHKGFSLSIPEAAKPGIYQRVRRIVMTEYMTVALFGAIILAVIVNVVELFCTAGLPALYTQILAMHQLPGWANYGYLALYNAAYMLDDTLLLAVCLITMSHRKLQEREGRWLKLVSGVVILALGTAMVFVPDWLS